MSVLPTGTVTLLLADVEGSTRLWETQPDEMGAAVARLDATVNEIVAWHGGVRPVEQGEGDSFVLAFPRASDGVACALELQRAPLDPIRLRIGLHTGEIQLRDAGNYIGPTINRTARLRDLAHGGQTVLSGTTADLVVDRLPGKAWLTEMGTHPLRDLPRAERVVQLCHPDLRNEFPPLRARSAGAAHHLPAELTSFVGRAREMAQLQQILGENRLVTLTGAGGAGKTRLAVRTAAELADGFGGGVFYVDLAPITDPDVVPVAVARALGLPDEPGRSTTETLLRFLADRLVLVVLDNCEHLLDSTAELVTVLLGACPGLTLLATSREPISVPGEVTWRVPSLSVGDEAVKLFRDRARLVRPGFDVTDATLAAVTEICRRLDGMPLAIELAAARVRALSLDEIVHSLNDRFRLLAGGARTAVRRQQTLRESVDWSHELLSGPERVLFRRLGVFLGGFDLDAARAVAADAGDERYEVLDELTLLVDKSLVVADEARYGTRYRLLETMRQYALEKLAESGESAEVRGRHRDHYTALAVLLDAPPDGNDPLLERVETDIDNLRAAFTWSRECGDLALAMQVASSLYPLWVTRGRMQEGLGWLRAALADGGQAVEPAALRVRALADQAILEASMTGTGSMADARQLLAVARDIGDPAVLARALVACGCVAGYDAALARPYFDEAIGLARNLGDRWRLSQIIGWQGYQAVVAGDPITARVAAEEGRNLAEAMGDRFHAYQCRAWLAAAQMMHGDLADAAAEVADLIDEAGAAEHVVPRALGLIWQACVLAYQGELGAARAAADAAVETGTQLGGYFREVAFAVSAVVALAAGDYAAATEAAKASGQHTGAGGGDVSVRGVPMAVAALAGGDLAASRELADNAVAVTTGWNLSVALLMRARIAMALGEHELAERDARDALARAAGVQAYLGVPDILECLAQLRGQAGRHDDAARLFGAAEGIRRRTGQVRFKIYDAGFHASVADVRNALGDNAFDLAWADGAAMLTVAAIAYGQRA